MKSCPQTLNETTSQSPLGEYPFSKRYGWVADRYGVSGAKVLLEAGRRKLIGGQEDQLIDIALMLKSEQEKDAANS